jgi:hypothetical protein
MFAMNTSRYCAGYRPSKVALARLAPSDEVAPSERPREDRGALEKRLDASPGRACRQCQIT